MYAQVIYPGDLTDSIVKYQVQLLFVLQLSTTVVKSKVT